MKIFKIWARYQQSFNVEKWEEGKTVGTEDKEFTFYGGSNVSEIEALEKAKERANQVKARINGEAYQRDESYEVDIREEIIAEVDQTNVITRNRYGAFVLNSAHTMFIDIDRDSFMWQYKIIPLFVRLYYRLTNDKEEDLIVNYIARKASENRFRNFYFRIYQTPAGYRVMVQGIKFEPRSEQSQSMMRSFKSDYMYAWLCRKQNCYRARLTPKPSRIKVKRHKVIFPFRTDVEEEIHQRWVENYETKSEGFSSCRLVKEIGTPIANKTMEYHDQFCKSNTQLPLA